VHGDPALESLSEDGDGVLGCGIESWLLRRFRSTDESGTARDDARILEGRVDVGVRIVGALRGVGGAGRDAWTARTEPRLGSDTR